jgi:transposase InsO family protein
MFTDTLKFTTNCPQCVTVTGGGRHHRPPLHPIPVSRPFQIVGVDVMELPKTDRGNRYVLVFQDFLTKWPFAFPMPDQKSSRIAELLVSEVVPLFGVPESLLSDRGTNLLSHLMLDICRMLGIKKLNTTAHHPQCDGMVERFNRTLKTMLRKHASKFGSQWDKYLAGALWAYRNVPHDSTNEKPSFLLLGVDCRTPTEAALLPPHELEATEVSDYREEVILSLSTARKLAAESIRAAQSRYKGSYDRSSREADYQLGDWVLVRFPQDETGRQRKLSRPWHGPYRVIDRRDPDVTVVKVYSPQDGQIQVHQTRVAHCPPELPSGFFWYGNRRAGPGRPPKWVDQLLSGDFFSAQGANTPSKDSVATAEEDPTTTPLVNSELPTSGAEPEDHSDDPGQSLITESTEDVQLESEADLDATSSESGLAACDTAAEDPDSVTMEKKSSDNSDSQPETHHPSQRKYGLRKKTTPPSRLMLTRSRASSSRGGRDVTL